MSKDKSKKTNGDKDNEMPKPPTAAARAAAIKAFKLDAPELAPAIDDAAIIAGGYPYAEKMKRKQYDKELEPLHIELMKLQTSIIKRGERVVIVFEGRDAAGKGGAIARLTQHLNPRSARVVALPKPTDVEKGQWYFQRYANHLPTVGEIVIFDRSWYNRAGVERVMGFCTKDQLDCFLMEAPQFEGMLNRDGIRLIKFYLNIGHETQLKRMYARQQDPLKHWKITPIDIAAIDKWNDYTLAQTEMFKATSTKELPWTVVRANCKLRTRLNVIRHLLLTCDYEGRDKSKIGAVDPKIVGSGPAFFTAGT